ncbi:hypothetical protein Pelo_4938 [Pelomyxa schiedti]|nr:hypothetical protein Pelo_4938 [Pelomyxa schiedti]
MDKTRRGPQPEPTQRKWQAIPVPRSSRSSIGTLQRRRVRFCLRAVSRPAPSRRRQPPQRAPPRCAPDSANDAEAAATKEIARDCLRLLVYNQYQQCYDLAWSLAGDDDDDNGATHKHADARAFALALLAFLYESYPKLFVHRQPFRTYLWAVLMQRAAECDMRCQEWMLNLLYSECARNPLEKVRAFCHFFLATVLAKSYGKFPFTSGEKTCSHGTTAAERGDLRALTAIGGFANLKYTASFDFCTAQRDLGVMYLKGDADEKVPLDKAAGMRLLRIAAEKGDPVAQVEVAIQLRKKDTSEAVRLFKLAAPQGFLDASIHLSQVYLTGPEHLRNVKEGLRIMSMAESVFTNKWMKQGKEEGSVIQERRYPAEMWASGFSTLAKVYWDGIGVKKDVKEAARLLHLSLQAVMHDDDVDNTLKLEVIMAIGQLYDKEYHDEREQSKWMKLLFVHRQPFPTNMWTMLLRRAAECDLRCQEWMVKLLNSECARNPLEKVRVFCHFFLAMVLDGFYGKFPFTSEEKSGSNCTIAAQGGDPRALTAIGGFDNLKHAASLGYCPAQRDLGVMYLKGKNNKQGDDAKAPLDETEGMKLLMIAAEKGDPLAQVEVACKLQKKHTSEAVRLFKLAAPQGFLDADIHLAQVYLTGPEHLLNVTEALRIMSMAESVFTNKWMKQGKEAGSAIQERRYPAEMWASGFSTLAKAYWDGIGVKKDVKEAARLLHLSLQAAMHHDAVENTHKLALAMGLGKLQPFPAYMRTMLLRRAAEFDARSQEWMVNMLYSECACNSSLEKVRALCHFLLAIVLSGSYGKFSFTSADRSCSNGKIAARLLDPHVLTVIGGFKNLKYAASLGYCAAQRELGMMFLNGEKHPVNDDNAPLTKTEGMRLLRIAAEKGDPVAQVEAAMKLRKKDPPEAVRLLKLAAAQGFFDADVLLSQVYLTGPEHLRNVKEGLRIMSVAESVFTNKWMKGEGECYPAEMWASGFATLAQLYWDGTGVKKDVKEAARLLHLALQSVMSDDDVENTLKLEVIMTLGQLYYKEYHDGREQSKWMKLVLDSNTHPLFCLALGRS